MVLNFEKDEIMIDSEIGLEQFLQNLRFRFAQPYIIGDVLDFGGNEGELEKFVTGEYMIVNYDHSKMKNSHADTIVCLAVIEHIELESVFSIFKRFKKILNKNGRIVITTPTIAAKPVLEFLAWIRVIDRANIEEHKYYWDKNDIYDLASRSGFIVTHYRRFEFGFNQLAVLEHA